MVSAWSGLNSFVSQTNDACSVVMNIDNRVITRRKFKMKRSQQAAADEMAAESKTGDTRRCVLVSSLRFPRDMTEETARWLNVPRNKLPAYRCRRSEHARGNGA